jgi:hypothetical protein
MFTFPGETGVRQRGKPGQSEIGSGKCAKMSSAQDRDGFFADG